jgi:putative flippase GtrA
MRTGLKQFIKFGTTGGLGTLTNLLLFFLLADKASLPEIPVSIVCFIIAGTQNYIINHKWSFADTSGMSRLSVKKWMLFLCASLAGLALNISVMKLIISNFILPYKFIAQAAGIAAGMMIKFTLSKLLVWRKRK